MRPVEIPEWDMHKHVRGDRESKQSFIPFQVLSYVSLSVFTNFNFNSTRLKLHLSCFVLNLFREINEFYLNYFFFLIKTVVSRRTFVQLDSSFSTDTKLLLV